MRYHVEPFRGVAEIQQVLHESVGFGAVDVERLSSFFQVHGFHQAEQTGEMIGMPVRDEYVADTHKVKPGCEYLSLRALAAIKQAAVLVLALVSNI